MVFAQCLSPSCGAWDAPTPTRGSSPQEQKGESHHMGAKAFLLVSSLHFSSVPRSKGQVLKELLRPIKQC